MTEITNKSYKILSVVWLPFLKTVFILKNEKSKENKWHKFFFFLRN